MKVFISWSGERSKALATALREWLPQVIQNVTPWMSEADIEAGVPWAETLARELSKTDFAILCLTAENLPAPWVLFEAGAASKSVEKAHVCPFLLGLDKSEVQWPLAQFQANLADRDGTFAIVRTMNLTMKNRLPDANLTKSFDKWWPDLEQRIQAISPSVSETEPKRKPEDLLEEVLELVRSTARSQVDMREELLRRLVALENRILPIFGTSYDYGSIPGLLLDKLAYRSRDDLPHVVVSGTAEKQADTKE